MRADACDAAVRELLEAVAELERKDFWPATDGNVSLRVAADCMLISPSGIEKHKMTAADLIRCDFADPPGGVSSEWRMHRTLYRERADVGCVLHAHSPYLTAFAAAHRVPSRDLLAEMLQAVGEIVCVPFVPPGTEALGAALIQKGPRAAVYLLANHGVVAVGADPRAARHRLERAELAAQVEILAAQLGGGVPLNPAPFSPA